MLSYLPGLYCYLSRGGEQNVCVILVHDAPNYSESTLVPKARQSKAQATIFLTCLVVCPVDQSCCCKVYRVRQIMRSTGQQDQQLRLFLFNSAFHPHHHSVYHHVHQCIPFRVCSGRFRPNKCVFQRFRRRRFSNFKQFLTFLDRFQNFRGVRVFSATLLIKIPNCGNFKMCETKKDYTDVHVSPEVVAMLAGWPLCERPWMLCVMCMLRIDSAFN